MRGKLFIFDGIDGSGKSTIAKNLAKRFKGVYLKEPGTKGVRKLIRKAILQEIDPLTELFLFLADRRENYLEIKKLLNNGNLIFLDRSFPSTLAYQLMGKNLEKIISIENYLALDHLVRFHIEPDAVFIFDLPVDIALKRIKLRKRKMNKFEVKKFLWKVRRNFIYLAKKFGWIVINAEKKPKEIIDDIEEFLKDKI